MKLPKGLLENLKQGEAVIEALKTSSIASKPDWTILTDSRVIYFNEKHLGRYDMVVIPFTQLKLMVAERGMVAHGSIQFQKENGEEVKLERVPKKDIEPFVNALETAMNLIAVEPIGIIRTKGLMGKQSWVFEKTAETLFRSISTPPPPPPGYQPPPQQSPLEMLNMRYARGEITQEEFQRMRQTLGV
jgi:hypothetical protein